MYSRCGIKSRCKRDFMPQENSLALKARTFGGTPRAARGGQHEGRANPAPVNRYSENRFTLLAGKLFVILKGDAVTVELTPYDLTKGRIVYRAR